MQARSQVLRFGGAKHIFRRSKLFLLYVKIKFFGHSKIYGHKKLRALPRMLPVAKRACDHVENTWSGMQGQETTTAAVIGSLSPQVHANKQNTTETL